MQTIQDRGYVWKKGRALVPSWIAFAVVGLLEQHFARLVDYGFTAAIEDDLDEHRRRRHAVGRLADPVLLRLATSGEEGGIARAGGLKRIVSERLGDIDARGVNSIPLGPAAAASWSGSGRYGPYLERGDGGARQRARGPAAGRADRREGRASCSTPRRASASSAPTR